MDRMISTVAKLAQSGNRNDDDIIDRLHHRYTVLFLVIFTVIISTTQYVGTPIHCWAPPEFEEEGQQKYIDRICWISNTYNLPKDAVPGVPFNRKKYINYYQWVPMMLLTQAVMFRLPSLFWRLFSDRSGINVNNLVEAAETIQNALYPERREKTIRYMIRHLDHYLDYQRDYRGGACDSCQQCIARSRSRVLRGFLCGNRLGNYLVSLYAITKFLYLGNIVAQFFLLDLFLGGEYHLYGVRVILDFVQGGWKAAMSREEDAFPRVTLCDFTLRQMGNTHKHTVQCVLPLNFFSEKIYLALWFWLAALGLASVISIGCWAWVLLPVHGRRRYVRRNLKIMSRIKSSDGSSALGGGSGSSIERDRERKMSRRFAETYLRQDGVFVLKLVAKNSTELVVADIVAALWDNFRSKPPSMGSMIDRSHGGDGTNVIGGGRGGRNESPGIAYIADGSDLPMDPVDII